MDKLLRELAEYYGLELRDEPGCVIVEKDGTERLARKEDANIINEVAKVSYVKIDGIINTNLKQDEFLDKFLTWLESHGWCFCGITQLVNEDGEPNCRLRTRPGR